MNCRFCGTLLRHEFIDLANAPPSNAFLTAKQLSEPEVFYPLKLFVCDDCFLVQIDEYKKSQDIFNDKYVYFSSYSKSWLEHAKNYVAMIIERNQLNPESFVIEVASNDGYLLQYFKENGIPCLGIEPAKNTAEVARRKGIEVITEFFGAALAERLAEQGRQADLIIGNNVLAHVPDINDFVAGLKIALKTGGVITMEFPHLMRLVEQNQFDTIYHEHFSYLSCHTVGRIFNMHGLKVFDVEELPTHGGSLRIYAGHAGDTAISVSDALIHLLQEEEMRGMNTLGYYTELQDKADQIKADFLSFLINQKLAGKKTVAYGAAAKGNTLINYCGIKKDLIEFVVDASQHKQGKYLPGSHIPVVSEKLLHQIRPDFIVILPWNLKAEIMAQLDYIRSWNAKFVILIPELVLL
jgi:2-polyprenyl-3-methyl-5-hydroxy-6-metoxy-1,4-benzoquinol methylase